MFPALYKTDLNGCQELQTTESSYVAQAQTLILTAWRPWEEMENNVTCVLAVFLFYISMDVSFNWGVVKKKKKQKFAHVLKFSQLSLNVTEEQNITDCTHRWRIKYNSIIYNRLLPICLTNWNPFLCRHRHCLNFLCIEPFYSEPFQDTVLPALCGH